MKTEPCLCGDPECPRCFPSTLEMPLAQYGCDACGIIMEAVVMEDLPCGEDGDCPHVWNPVERRPDVVGRYICHTMDNGFIYEYTCERCGRLFKQQCGTVSAPAICNGCFRGITGVTVLILGVSNANSEETKPTAG